MASDARLIYLITKAQHCLKVYLKKAFAAESLDITPVQAAVLFLLRKEAHTMTRLSQELAIDNSAITGVVDRLEKAGLARRGPAPDDRRVFLIEITDRGKEVIDRALIVVRQVNHRIGEGFSPAEMETFKAVLNSFFAKFGNGMTP